ncbi:MAG: hypothetical protein AAGD18_26620, partial [Actinomycetota bacterium]
MLYVVGEIVIWLAAATLLGLGVGWLLFGFRRQPAKVVQPAPQQRSLDSSEVAELQEEAERFATMTAELEGLVGEHNETLTTLRSEADAAAALVAERDRELLDAQERIHALELALHDEDGVDVEAIGLRRELDERDAEVRDLRVELEQLRAGAAGDGTGSGRADELAAVRAELAERESQLAAMGEVAAQLAERESQLAAMGEVAAQLAERESQLAAMGEVAAQLAERES